MRTSRPPLVRALVRVVAVDVRRGKGVFTWDRGTARTRRSQARASCCARNEGGQMSSICDEQINTNPTAQFWYRAKTTRVVTSARQTRCAGGTRPDVPDGARHCTFDLTTGMFKCQSTADVTCEGDNCKSTVPWRYRRTRRQGGTRCAVTHGRVHLPWKRRVRRRRATVSGKRCKTNADGSKLCECGVKCVWYNGECHKDPDVVRLQRLNGVEDVCLNPGGHVSRGGVEKWSGLKLCQSPIDRQDCVFRPTDKVAATLCFAQWLWRQSCHGI